MRKHVIGRVRLGKTQTDLLRYRSETLDTASTDMKAANNKDADQTAQADLRLCCSHIA